MNGMRSFSQKRLACGLQSGRFPIRRSSGLFSFLERNLTRRERVRCLEQTGTKINSSPKASVERERHQEKDLLEAMTEDLGADSLQAYYELKNAFLRNTILSGCFFVFYLGSTVSLKVAHNPNRM